MESRGIIVADYAVATNAPTGSWNVDWTNVYNYQGSSGVAVGSHWLLTAAHVGDDLFSTTLTINGTNYYQQEIVFHSAAHDPAHSNKADLALIRFDKAFPGYYPLFTGTFPTQTFPTDRRRNSVLVGFGTTGQVFSTYYQDSQTGNTGTARWGSNKIDYPTSANYDVQGSTGLTFNDGIALLFTLSGTPYEAGVGIRDSGGGVFVNDAGTWKLAGIITSRYGGPTDLTGTFAVSVPAYAAWITAVTNPAGDLDGDGIPNGWEQRYGSTTGLVASADNDLDGYTNASEYEADTHPLDPASRLAFTGWEAADPLSLDFNGSTGRLYQVFCTTNALTDSPMTWSPVHAPPVPGTGPQSSITVSPPADARFFRLQVTLPP
jgi:hypothetical protein